MSATTQQKKPSRGKKPIHTAAIASDVTAEIQYNGINPNEPIPLELENIYGYSPGGNLYIPFFKGDSKFYGSNAFLLNMLNWRKESVTQNACIVSKTNYATGDGLYVDGIDPKELATKDPIWTEFVKRCNPNPEGLNRILKQVFDNFFTFGNVPIEIVKGVVAGKKFLYVYVKNTLDCRKEWPNAQNHSEAMIISRWFRKPGVYNLTEKFNIRIPFYKMGKGMKKDCWMVDDKDNQGGNLLSPVMRTALWLKNDFPGYDHYGLPSNIPDMRSAMLEANAGQFNLDNIENNMVVGGVLVLAGNVTPQEQARIANTITKKYTGKGKTGRTIVIASEEGITDSKYTPQDTHKEGSFSELKKITVADIIRANEWDESFLGGHDGASKAKSGAFLNELYQQKIKTVIKPVHRIIKDDFIAPLCEIADEWLGTKWSQYDIDIQISQLFDDTTEASTTVLGLQAFYILIDKVSSGALPSDAAVKIAVLKFGMEESEAKEIFSAIKIVEQKPKPAPTTTE